MMITPLATTLHSYAQNTEIMVEGDVLVLLVSKAGRTNIPDMLPPSIGEAVQSIVDNDIFIGEQSESVWLPVTQQYICKFLLLVGAGSGETLQNWREAAAKAAREARRLKAAKATALIVMSENQIATPTAVKGKVGQPDSSLVYAVVEGFQLGQYQMKLYRHHQEESVQLALSLWVPAELDSDVQAAAAKGDIYAAATNYARNLTNLPGNLLVPEQLANEAKRLADQCGLTYEVLTEEEIAKQGMGGLLAVGQGSTHPPRMITLRYTGNPDSAEVIGLVGKGITFDTGGISLKKAAGMEEMTSDMAGAATVLGVFHALGKLQPRVNVIGVIPTAENMPSGTAYRPGDIVTTLSGKTIEILNTDAEGRVVLADAVTYAKQQGASKLIELSTLTGAVLVALGDTATAAITNNDELLAMLQRASKQTGELMWQLPAFPEYKEMIKSDVADVKNSTGRNAGTITGGLFVATFAEDTPFVHLDIAGTAWLTKTKAVDPKGATGVMVRTITEAICSHNTL